MYSETCESFVPCGANVTVRPDREFVVEREAGIRIMAGPSGLWIPAMHDFGIREIAAIGPDAKPGTAEPFLEGDTVIVDPVIGGRGVVDGEEIFHADMMLCRVRVVPLE